MNISGGDSSATPFWQTNDLRLGVVGNTPGERSLSVLLSCGTHVRAKCPSHVRVIPGVAVQVERRHGVWHVRRCLEPTTGELTTPETHR